MISDIVFAYERGLLTKRQAHAAVIAAIKDRFPVDLPDDAAENEKMPQPELKMPQMPQPELKMPQPELRGGSVA